MLKSFSPKCPTTEEGPELLLSLLQGRDVLTESELCLRGSLCLLILSCEEVVALEEWARLLATSGGMFLSSCLGLLLEGL